MRVPLILWTSSITLFYIIGWVSGDHVWGWVILGLFAAAFLALLVAFVVLTILAPPGLGPFSDPMKKLWEFTEDPTLPEEFRAGLRAQLGRNRTPRTWKDC